MSFRTGALARLICVVVVKRARPVWQNRNDETESSDGYYFGHRIRNFLVLYDMELWAMAKNNAAR